MTSFAIESLGCKVNTYESVSIKESLLNEGFIEKSFDDFSDVYIIFTCAVTNVASSKSRKKINQAIRHNKDAIIVAVGCYVQLKPEELMGNDGIDIYVGSNNKANIVKYINDFLVNREKIIAIDDVRKDVSFESLDVKDFDIQTRAFLKIQDGCNQFCSYCVIPYARGKERSMDKEEVIRNIKDISVNHKEIVLSGIHTGRYRSNNYDLTSLIKAILKETSIQRIRISSIEISEISDELIDLINLDNRLAKHLHIPLQSGSDYVLRSMNRPYDTKYFLDRINYIRSKISDISISTDLIVGYPLEDEERFSETLGFIKECKFSFIHVFPFSSKKNTVAAKLKDVNSGNIKKDRVKIVSNISDEMNLDYLNSFIGKDVEVIIEKYEDGYSFGHSSEYIPVMINREIKRNEFIKVKAIDVKNLMLVGE